MLSIDSLERGVVIDHIKAGKSMEIYKYLKLDKLNCSVAIIKNVKSHVLGRKDIIKIDDKIDIDLDMLGYIDPNITIVIIESGTIKSKNKLKLPQRIKNIKICKNPRCITGVEQEIESIFELADAEKHIYRCIYCEQES